MNTIELLEQIRKDFVKEFDNDPQINRVCKVVIHEYKLRSEALSLGVVSNNEVKLCDKCYDTDGFYLGTTCPKCNKSFRIVQA